LNIFAYNPAHLIIFI